MIENSMVLHGNREFDEAWGDEADCEAHDDEEYFDEE